MRDPSLLPSGYFTAPVTQTDPLIARAIASESKRQHDVIELIASENIVSRAVLDVQGSILTNKTVEGYPGKRYHAGAVNVDAIERAAIDRACQLFGCRFANVQPHSGSQANHAVLHAVAEPGDTILSMDLNAGGHLSHGAAVNFSGKWFKEVNYGVRAGDGLDSCSICAKGSRQRRSTTRSRASSRIAVTCCEGRAMRRSQNESKWRMKAVAGFWQGVKRQC